MQHVLVSCYSTICCAPLVLQAELGKLATVFEIEEDVWRALAADDLQHPTMAMVKGMAWLQAGVHVPERVRTSH